MKVAGTPRALFAIGFGIASSLAGANPPRTIYYDISGNAAADLRRELDAKGPVDERGIRGDGYTHWYVRWNFRYVPVTGGCRFSEIDVTVTGEITMPRWAPPAAVPGALTSKWQAYLVALRVHEDGHYANGIRAADEIRALGQAFSVSGNCSRIGQFFNERAEVILDKYRAADLQYDAETGHGRTQGVVFP